MSNLNVYCNEYIHNHTIMYGDMLSFSDMHFLFLSTAAATLTK